MKFGQTSENYINNTLSQMADEDDNSLVSNATVEVLEELILKLTQIRGNLPQSIGILPAFYFYSTKGQYRQILFLLYLMWFTSGSTEDIKNRKYKFSSCRELFEDVWMLIKDYLVKYYGRKGAGPSRLTKRHTEILDNLLENIIEGKKNGNDSISIAKQFLSIIDIKALAEFEKDFKTSGTPFKHFSNGTKTQQELYAFFKGTYKCELCGGAIEIGVSQQFDHVLKRSEGGSNDVKNSRITHPWCNNNRDKLEKNQNVAKTSQKEAMVHPPEIKPIPELTYEQIAFEL